MKITNLQLRPDMALAWADGRKCRTQRVIKSPEAPRFVRAFFRGFGHWRFWRNGDLPGGPFEVEKTPGVDIKCPYGRAGDRLRLLTVWAVGSGYDEVRPSELPTPAQVKLRVWTAFDGPKPDWAGRKRPGRFMPGWMREPMPQPKILSIRARRIQEITIEECIEEGIPDELPLNNRGTGSVERDYFSDLWDSIDAKRGYPWELNPWVWDIRFQSREDVGGRDMRCLQWR